MEKIKGIPSFFGKIAKMGENLIISIPSYQREIFKHRENVVVLLLDERLLKLDSPKVKETEPFINFLRTFSYGQY